MTTDPTNPKLTPAASGPEGFNPAELPELSELEALLADRATQGLDDAQATRLAELLERAGLADDVSFDVAATAFDRAIFARAAFGPEASEPVPAHLLAALDREGQAWSAGLSAGATSNRQSVLARIGSSPVRSVHGAVTSVLESRHVRGPMVMSRRYMREWSGWIAAAACLGLAFLTWQRSGRTAPSAPQAANIVPANLIPTDLLRPVERFAEDLGLRATQRLHRFMSDPYSDLVVVPIGEAKPIASGDVSVGEVVWNRADGSGVLRLRVNDPAALKGGHFQLWIFDTARNEHLPIDGGVIEVQPGQTEVLVPIDPSLPVGRAAAFAVTRELAGGSVVSNRQRLVAVGVAEGMAPPPVFEDEPAPKAK